MTAIQLNLLGGEQTARTTDDYYTPRWIFDALGLTFDLDVACPPEGSVNVPAAHWYTAADDGLSKPWFGRVWMNPPYSKPSPWVNRWIAHNNGMALLPLNGGQWCKQLWESNAKGVWLSRLAFIRNGEESRGSPLNIVLWALGDDNIEAIAKLGRPR